MRAVADSSFLVALFYPPDVHHGEAVKHFEELETVYVHHDLLKEALTVLMYRFDVEMVKEIYEKVTGSDAFVVSYFGLEDVTGFWLNLGRRISYFDAVGILLALKLGSSLLTFDKEQRRVYERIMSAAGVEKYPRNSPRRSL